MPSKPLTGPARAEALAALRRPHAYLVVWHPPKIPGRPPDPAEAEARTPVPGGVHERAEVPAAVAADLIASGAVGLLSEGNRRSTYRLTYDA